jgi:uncharacterized membrane protein
MSSNPAEDIIHRQLDRTGENTAVQITNIIAELEEKEVSKLYPIYDQMDDVLDNIFSEPPSPEAQLQITFSYEGYRITIEQDGHAAFIKIS